MSIAMVLLGHLSFSAGSPRWAEPLAPIATLGVAIFFVLYIWQQLFLGTPGRHWWTIFPVNLLGALAAAVASHVLIERSFLRLRERFVS